MDENNRFMYKDISNLLNNRKERENAEYIREHATRQEERLLSRLDNVINSLYTNYQMNSTKDSRLVEGLQQANEKIVEKLTTLESYIIAQQQQAAAAAATAAATAAAAADLPQKKRRRVEGDDDDDDVVVSTSNANKVKQWKEKVAELKDSLDEKERETSDLETKVRAKDALVGRLKTDTQDKENRIQEKEAELLSLKNNLNDKEAEHKKDIQRIKTEAQQKETELKNKDAEVQRITSDLQTKEAELQTRESEFQKIKTELQKKDAEIKTKDADLQKRDTELQKVRSELQQKEDEIKIELQNRDNEINQIKIDLKKTIAQEKDAEYLAKLKEKDDELAVKLKAKLKEKDDELADKLKAKLKEKDDELADKLKELKDKLKEKDGELADKLKELKGKDGELADKLKEKDDKFAVKLKDKLKEKDDELQDKINNSVRIKDAEISTLKGTVKSTADELVDKNADIFSLKSTLNIQDTTINKLKDKLKDKDNELDTLKKDKDKEIDTLKSKVNTEIDTLKKDKDKEIDILKSKVKDKDTEIDTLKRNKDTEIVELKSELQSIQTQLKEAITKKGELGTLKGEITRLKVELNKKSGMSTTDSSAKIKLETKVADLESELNTKSDALKDRDAEIIKIKREKDTEIQGLKNQLKGEQDEYKKLLNTSGAVGKYQAKIVELEKQLQERDTVFVDLTKTLEENKLTVEEKDRTIASLSSSTKEAELVNELNSLKATNTKETLSLQTKLQEIETKLQEKDNKLQEIETKLSEKEKILTAKEATLNQLQTKLATPSAAEAQLKELSAEHKTKLEELKRLKPLEHTNNNLVVQLKERDKKIVYLNDRVSTLEAQLINTPTQKRKGTQQDTRPNKVQTTTPQTTTQTTTQEAITPQTTTPQTTTQEAITPAKPVTRAQAAAQAAAAPQAASIAREINKRYRPYSKFNIAQKINPNQPLDNMTYSQQAVLAANIAITAQKKQAPKKGQTSSDIDLTELTSITYGGINLTKGAFAEKFFGVKNSSLKKLEDLPTWIKRHQDNQIIFPFIAHVFFRDTKQTVLCTAGDSEVDWLYSWDDVIHSVTKKSALTCSYDQIINDAGYLQENYGVDTVEKGAEFLNLLTVELVYYYLVCRSTDANLPTMVNKGKRKKEQITTRGELLSNLQTSVDLSLWPLRLWSSRDSDLYYDFKEQFSAELKDIAHGSDWVKATNLFNTSYIIEQKENNYLKWKDNKQEWSDYYQLMLISKHKKIIHGWPSETATIKIETRFLLLQYVLTMMLEYIDGLKKSFPKTPPVGFKPRYNKNFLKPVVFPLVDYEANTYDSKNVNPYIQLGSGRGNDSDSDIDMDSVDELEINRKFKVDNTVRGRNLVFGRNLQFSTIVNNMVEGSDVKTAFTFDETFDCQDYFTEPVRYTKKTKLIMSQFLLYVLSFGSQFKDNFKDILNMTKISNIVRPLVDPRDPHGNFYPFFYLFSQLYHANFFLVPFVRSYEDTLASLRYFLASELFTPPVNKGELETWLDLYINNDYPEMINIKFTAKLLDVEQKV